MKSTPLPEKIIVGYANWNQCDDTIVQAAKDGVNVIIWFAINLASDGQGNPSITNGPDWTCVAEKIKTIRDLGLPTVHLISIGGWNAPHPDTSVSAASMFAYWDNWNKHTISTPQLGFYGFDGFDWDIEGNDDLNSPNNVFTVTCLDFMGEFSQLAKKAGYVVSMAPAESYVDHTTSAFDRALNHEYPEWQGIIPTFPYHGQNVYSYLLSRYAYTSIVEDNDTNDAKVHTFDFVTIQLYEGYSHAEYNVQQLKTPAEDVLVDFVEQTTDGWDVDFRTDVELQYDVLARISVDVDRLVVGLANGWAGDGKFLLIYPDQVEKAYNILQSKGLAVRGFAFWNILDEGKASVQQPGRPVYMAKGLNRFLHIREVE
eukprot:gene39102-47577_t